VKATIGLLFSSAVLVHAASVVSIDADKVLIVNGRKVFPIAMSPGPPTRGRTPTGVDALGQ
jgi:hypothetical protein